MLHLLRTCSKCGLVCYTVSAEEAWRDSARLRKEYEAMDEETRATYMRPVPTQYKECPECHTDYREFRDFEEGDRLDRGAFPPILAPEERLVK